MLKELSEMLFQAFKNYINEGNFEGMSIEMFYGLLIGSANTALFAILDALEENNNDKMPGLEKLKSDLIHVYSQNGFVFKREKQNGH